MEFSYRTRQQWLETLNQQEVDILVVGGGITGAGIAREAALRGYSVALVEKHDFGSGTSSRSSKLVHGGFRYMAQWHFGLVHEALVERYHLMQLAPHLVHPQPFLLPIYKDQRMPPWMIHLGLLLYDWLTFGRNIGHHRMLPPAAVAREEPLLTRENLRKAALYFDARVDDFRLVLATIKAAVFQGAIAVNYVEARQLESIQGPFGVRLKDRLSGDELTVRARTVANASGPWCDAVLQQLTGEAAHHVRPTKGIHLVVRQERLPIRHAVTLFAPVDGRPIFAIPFPPYVLLGTTDTDFKGAPEQVTVHAEDVQYLLDAFNHYFPEARLQPADVLSTYAGVRPLIFEKNKKASEVSREHQIFQGPPGLFSIIGGKLTTYRVMARDMVALLGKHLAQRYGVQGKPDDFSLEIPLWGGRIARWEEFYQQYHQVLVQEGLRPETADHLLTAYGSDVVEVMRAIRQVPDGANRIHPELPYLWGELEYQLEQEMGLRVEDFLVRRMHIFSLDEQQGKGVLPAVIQRVAARLGWSPQFQQRETERYLEKIQRENQWRQVLT